MNKRNIFQTIGCCLLCAALSSLLSSCSEEKNEGYLAAVEITDSYIDQLDELIAEMNKLLQTSDFGTKKDQYPDESRGILNDAISSANRAVLLIKYQTPAPSESEKARYVAAARASIEQFKASVRTKDATTTPAVLFVNGRGSGADSYINFGHDEEYYNFGEDGKQAFTVEFWVKVIQAGGKDQNVFLNTLVDGYGWSMYWRQGNYRGTWGDKEGYCEPQFAAPDDSQWVHFLMTYSDTGLPGAPDLRAKEYVNGELRATEGNVGGRTYKFNPFASNNKPMTSFGRYMRLGDDQLFEEGFAGYIKNIRIWKEAKDEAYVSDSYNGDITVTGREETLVAAWDFTSKPTGSTSSIVDLTGRHTATIVGDYRWERVIEE